MANDMPGAILYLENVLSNLDKYCDNLDLDNNDHVRPPKGCECVACRLAMAIDAALNREWKRWKSESGQQNQENTSAT